jgi:hypothetical protein
MTTYITLPNLLRLNRQKLNELSCLQEVPPVIQHRRQKGPDGEYIRIFDSIGIVLNDSQIAESWREFEDDGEEADIYDLCYRRDWNVEFDRNVDKWFAAWLELIHDAVAIGEYQLVANCKYITPRLKEAALSLKRFTKSRKDREDAFKVLLNALEADYWSARYEHPDTGYQDGYYARDYSSAAWENKTNRGTSN